MLQRFIDEHKKSRLDNIYYQYSIVLYTAIVGLYIA